MLLFTNLYIFFLAVVLAVLEIQIEGEAGWARNLPTWRPDQNKWYSKLYAKLMSNRELTGYHLTMFAFVLLIFNLPFAFGLNFNFENFLKVFSLYILFIPLWDFFWFVLNPHYPLSKFKKEHIWWHKKWLLGLPQDYYFSVIISFVSLLPAYFLKNQTYLLNWWILNLGLFLIETLVLILFAHFILGIDNWHTKKNSAA